jgi:hypothetical protein
MTKDEARKIAQAFPPGNTESLLLGLITALARSRPLMAFRRPTMIQAGVNEMARHLFTNAEGIKRLQESGVIERLPDGQHFDLDDTRRRYLEHLRSRPRGGGANQKLLEARARLTEIRIAEREGRLADVEEMVNALAAVTAWYVAALEGLPGAIAKARGDRELRQELEVWVHNTRTALADKSEAQANAMEKTGQGIDVWAA